MNWTPYKFISLNLLLIALTTSCKENNDSSKTVENETQKPHQETTSEGKSHPLVDAARKQIGVVKYYDGSYFAGGYPPKDRGVCTDVIERALRLHGYRLKEELDRDFKTHRDRYPGPFDGNMNFRRVRNLIIFFNHYAEEISTCTADSCFEQGIWKPGDIVTFDQIPGSLWHIAIISNKYERNERGIKIPYIIHNAGGGTKEEFSLLSWPAAINGHYRLDKLVNFNK